MTISTKLCLNNECDNFILYLFEIFFELRKVHLLVQGDVIDPDPCLSSEVVGAVVAVLQHGPAVW